MHYLYTIQTADTEQKVITILKLQIISFEIKKETKTNPLYKGWASDLAATKLLWWGRKERQMFLLETLYLRVQKSDQDNKET